MVGSDVVVAGHHGSNAFAIDSYITAVQECSSYTGGQANGVCDDHACVLHPSLTHPVLDLTAVRTGRPVCRAAAMPTTRP